MYRASVSSVVGRDDNFVRIYVTACFFQFMGNGDDDMPTKVAQKLICNEHNTFMYFEIVSSPLTLEEAILPWLLELSFRDVHHCV